MRKIIVVDDEPITRMDICEILREANYEVVAEAGDGFDAIEQSRKYKPDFVIMDVKMPILDGLKAAKIITENKLSRGVVLLTAYSNKEFIEEAKNIGIIGYIVKPIDEKSFIPNLEIIFNKQEEFEELEKKYSAVKELAEKEHKRIVILGSGILKGLSEELSLKIMELSGGKVVSVSNTPLGFRHGPKAIINEETVIFELVNQNGYAQKYDEGLLEEMYEEKIAERLVAYCIDSNETIKAVTHETLQPSESEIRQIADKELASLFIYLVYGQMYAFFKSQYLGNTTDNPFPTGEVNRVVKKFKIHKFENK